MKTRIRIAALLLVLLFAGCTTGQANSITSMEPEERSDNLDLSPANGSEPSGLESEFDNSSMPFSVERYENDKEAVFYQQNEVIHINAINTGQATRIGNEFTINGRVYGVMPSGELYPIQGDGFYLLDRGEFRALLILKEYGNTELGQLRLQQNQLSAEAIARALEVYNQILGN